MLFLFPGISQRAVTKPHSPTSFFPFVGEFSGSGHSFLEGHFYLDLRDEGKLSRRELGKESRMGEMKSLLTCTFSVMDCE